MDTVVRKGRKPVELNKEEFQAVLTKLETDNKFGSRQALWQAVSETEWAKSRLPRPLTAQVAMLKAKALNLNVSTSVGVRGQALKEHRPVGGHSRSRRIALVMVEPIRKAFPTKYHATIDKLAKGSLKSAIRAKCLDCSAFQQAEIRYCTVVACPLHPFRPFQNDNSVLESETQNEGQGTQNDSIQS